MTSSPARTCPWLRWALIALAAASLAIGTPASAGHRHHHRHKHSRSHDNSGAALAALAVLGIVGFAALAASAQPEPAVIAPPPSYPMPGPTSGRPVIFNAPPVYGPAPSAPISAEPIAPPYRLADGRMCQAYQSNAVIGGVARPVQGTACLEPDGVWRIVN